MEVESVPVVVIPMVKLRGSWDALTADEAVEVLNFANSVNVNVSVAEVLYPACEPVDPLAPFGPQFKAGSVDEVSCSVVKFVFFAIILVVAVTHVGSVPEVNICDVQSIGPVLKADPCVQVIDAVE